MAAAGTHAAAVPLRTRGLRGGSTPGCEQEAAVERGWTRACRQQEAPRRLAGSEEEARGMGMRAGGRCDNAKGRAQAAGKLLLLASRLLSIASAAIPSIASVSRFPENECHRGRSIWDMSGDVENLARSLRGRRRVCAV